MDSAEPIPQQRYRADIQGLRALAIVPVVLYHAHRDWAPGGFVGVDVFFVISGYLISRILLRELQTDHFSIANFYERRVRRLFPALYLVLAFAVAAGYFLLPPAALLDLGKSVAATAAFLSNLYFWKVSGYFDPAAELKPLLHTWSLAVEEQFYLLYPIFLFLLYRYLRRHVAAALWLCALASLAIAVWQAEARPLDGFYLPLGRAYELLIGAIVAAAPLPRIRRAGVADFLSTLGVAMILASIVLFRREMHFPGAWALLPCVGSALILYIGTDHSTLAGRLLGTPVPVFFGGISYSLYLWHWPALAFARYFSLGEPNLPVVGAVVAGAILAAWLSWRYVEQPFLHGKLPGRRIFIAGAAAMAIAFAVAGLFYVTKGLPQRFDRRAHAMFAAEADYNSRRPQCHASRRQIAYADNCIFGAPNAVPDTAVWGDSLGAEFSVVLGEQAAARGGAVMQITASSCPPAADFAPDGSAACLTHSRDTLAALTADPRIRTVYLVAAFADYRVEEHSRIIAAYARAATALHAAGKRLVLIYPIPKLPFPAPTALGLMAKRGAPPGQFGVPTAAFREANSAFVPVLDKLVADLGAQRIAPADRLCDPSRCHAYINGVGVLYFDDLHPSLTGARHILGLPPRGAAK
jgi:peptidoglycan/LPS O-acetylase OafA/YrhL